MNDQRKVIYEQRNDVLDAEAVDEVVEDMRAETVNGLVGEACPPNTYPEQWDAEGLAARVRDVLALELPVDQWFREEGIEPEQIEDRIREASTAHIAAKQADLEEGIWGQIEKSVLLQSLDHHWKEHLSTLDALRQVIHLRAYAQKTPINEYKREAFALFERMLTAIREDVTKVLSYAQFQMAPPELPEMPEIFASHIDPLTGENDAIANPLGLVTTRLPPLQLVEHESDVLLGEDPHDWEGRVAL
jgi:preprotein translocase subunit SecA